MVAVEDDPPQKMSILSLRVGSVGPKRLNPPLRIKHVIVVPGGISHVFFVELSAQFALFLVTQV